MSTIAAWPGRAENWLDDRGKGAWIAAMVLGFIVFWPVGLALLAYMIWSKRMFSKSCARSNHNTRFEVRLHRHGFRSSGNSSFDAYKADTLDRLEREQEDFEAFLKRLRESKDKAEFDQYLDERAKAARDAGEERAEDTLDGGHDDSDRRTSRGQY
ncbi:MAG: DUF2852 domain-containing protein [Paracoccaceae bacterium]